MCCARDTDIILVTLQMLARWVTPWHGWLATILYSDLGVFREEVLLGDLVVVLALQERAATQPL